MRLSAISLVISAAACAPFAPPPHPPAYRWAVLQVDNRGTRDLNVFALQTSAVALSTTHPSAPSTTRVRLGRVGARTTTEFAIPMAFLPDKYTPVYERYRPIHFVIDEINGKSGVIDQELLVTPVDTVAFTIPPT